MREASRRYRVVLLPLGADDARAAIEQRLASDGYWEASLRRRVIRRRKLLAGAIAAIVAVLGGIAVGVALSTGPDKHEAAATTTAVVQTTADPARAPETTRRATRPRLHTVAPPLLPKVSIPVKPVATTPAVVPKVVEPASVPERATVSVETTTKKPMPKKIAPKPVAKPRPKPPPATTSATATTGKPLPKVAPKPVVTARPTPRPATNSATATAKKPRPDTVAPTVTITKAPGAATSTDSAQIGFTANEAGVSFGCRLDGAGYTSCASPAALTGLAPGLHTFWVRATDKAGNVGQDAIATWTYTPPDTTPPVVTITAAPASSTAETEASFSFGANEDGATFACALDGGAVSACTSPVLYTGLGVGSHSFSAQATDKAGNTGAAATHAWAIVAPLPDLYVSAFTKFMLTVTNRGQAAAGRSILTITSIGTFTVPALEPGQSATFSWSICRPTTYSAVVDRTDVVNESDERNNSAALANACP